MDMTEKTRENKIRRMAKRLGYIVKKSRERYVYPESATNFGKFQLADEHGNVKIGKRFDISLDEIEKYLLERVQFEVDVQRQIEVNEKISKFFSLNERALIKYNPQLKEKYDILPYKDLEEIDNALYELRNELHNTDIDAEIERLRGIGVFIPREK